VVLKRGFTVMVIIGDVIKVSWDDILLLYSDVTPSPQVDTFNYYKKYLWNSENPSKQDTFGTKQKVWFRGDSIL